MRSLDCIDDRFGDLLDLFAILMEGSNSFSFIDKKGVEYSIKLSEDGSYYEFYQGNDMKYSVNDREAFVLNIMNAFEDVDEIWKSKLDANTIEMDLGILNDDSDASILPSYSDLFVSGETEVSSQREQGFAGIGPVTFVGFAKSVGAQIDTTVDVDPINTAEEE